MTRNIVFLSVGIDLMQIPFDRDNMNNDGAADMTNRKRETNTACTWIYTLVIPHNY